MSDIVVDTYKLRQYAQRLDNVNKRIVKLDTRLDGLYSKVGLCGLWDLIRTDALTGYSWKLLRCAQYLQQTAINFENAEKRILAEDPLKYSGASVKEIMMPLVLRAVDAHDKNEEHLLEIIKSQFTQLPDDVEDAGDALTWLEKHYGNFPKYVTQAVDVFVPSTLQNAYIFVSGIFQGDLTGEELWDTAKSILPKKSKLAIVAETVEYTFDTGVKRSEEMERQMSEQIEEGDILGTVFDGVEGFVDIIIGGSIEVIGNAAGGIVDSAIDDTPIIKGINKFAEYVTGLFGWNDGDGYSIGGLIGHTAERISGFIDDTTDFITDVTDVVTDGIANGVKTGINWVKSWFD